MMEKRIAVLVYPQFSLQEVTNLMYLFRWNYEIMTDIVYTDKEPVQSEEGVSVLPDKTCSEFHAEDYKCLILPGCSDIRDAIHNQKLKMFLESFRDNTDFLIGAICSGPVFLAQAGLLQGKRYTDSLFVEMREQFPFIEEQNFIAAPVVESENIITAGGSAFNDFAVHIARKLGYECPDHILSGYMDDWKQEDYMHHLSQEDNQEFQNNFYDLLKK
ncbi:MAG: DJ-1/PfpI family protein [Clostridium sp.]|nr:DJ-1/PfpI family protein [Clostridium sp.]